MIESIFAPIRRFFLLERDGARSLSPSQFSAMQSHYAAAMRRLRASPDLRGLGHTPLAICLYRDGAQLLMLAFLASKGEVGDVGSPASLLERFSMALATDEVRVPPQLERVSPLLTRSDPLELDRMGADAARRTADELDVVTSWIANLIEPRSPAQLKKAHYWRLAVAAIALVALLTGVLVWALTPKNLALHKPTTSSSHDFGTKPEGAVDGDMFTRFGFHSGFEQSPWLAIDLGARYTLARVKVRGRGDCCFDQSVPLALEVSDDGITYKTLSERKVEFSQSAPWVVMPDSATARFVRLRTQRQSYLVLSEVEVNGQVAK